MAETTKIEWTATINADGTRTPGATFNPLKKRLAPLAFSQVSHAFGLEVFEFVAVVAQRNSVRDFKSKLRKFGKRFDMMSAQIAAFATSAFSTGVFIALKNCRSPDFIFRRAATFQITLMFAVGISVMIFATRRPFSRNLANLFACLGSVLYPCSIAPSLFGRIAHFGFSLIRHFASLQRRHFLPFCIQSEFT